MTNKYICKVCGKEFLEWRKPRCIKKQAIPMFCSKKCRSKYSANKMKVHVCNFPKHYKKDGWKCIACKKIFKTRKELIEHKRTFHPAINVWNKGLTKETDERVLKATNTLKHTLNTKYLMYGWKRNPEVTEKARIKQIESYKNNPRQINPRGKAGWYKEIWCDSSWELAYVLWCEENNIKLKRCTDSLPYYYKNKLHYYTPDFIINEKDIIEIKGYCSDKDREKIKQYPNITVLYKKDLELILNWIKEKYGKDFTKLYTKTKSIRCKKLN